MLSAEIRLYEPVFITIFFSFKTKKTKSLENVQRVSLALLTMLPERPWNGVVVKFGYQW